MKTLKTLKVESRKFYSENTATYFSKPFNKKMGGTQKITFEDDFLESIKIDKREFYTGRGAKYNSNSMHEHLEVFVKKSDFEDRVNHQAKTIFENEKRKIEIKKILKNFCIENNLNFKNYNSISENFIFFDIDKKSEIEKELNINLDDFFNTSGKTYYFADSKIGLVRFYHNHHQSYGFEKVSESVKNEFLNEREKWLNAPYSHLVGNKPENQNLYVC